MSKRKGRERKLRAEVKMREKGRTAEGRREEKRRNRKKEGVEKTQKGSGERIKAT